LNSTLSSDHTERLLELSSEPYGTGKLIAAVWMIPYLLRIILCPAIFLQPPSGWLAGSIQPDAYSP
jgi:hypothetical protein